MNPVLIHTQLVTAAATGLAPNFEACLARQRAFSAPMHFSAGGRTLGVIHALDSAAERGARLLDLLAAADGGFAAALPAEVPFFVSTTIGEIDRIERGERLETGEAFARDAATRFSKPRFTWVAAACASGHAAAIAAARAIRAGQTKYAIALGGDIVSEFTHSGFSALGAVSAGNIRPYDAHRDGLTLGEAAALVVLADPEAAAADGFPALAELAGWGETCDGTHITRPDLEGRQLARAIRQALDTAGLTPDAVGCILGHGTGTVFNDQAEIAALHAVFGERALSLFSCKGNFGHTLGATGLLQIALAAESLRRQQLPPQAGLETPMPGAERWIFSEPRSLATRAALSLTIGFGGINDVIALNLS